MVSLLLWALATLAAPAVNCATTINATPKSATLVGQLNNPGITRDSCNSAAFGDLGILWTCRDTQPVEDNQAKLPVVVNTASWSTSDPNMGEGLALNTPALDQPFYPLAANECAPNSAGMCDNSTRWVAWPNTGPLVVFAYEGSLSAYAWIPKQNLKGLSVVNQAYHSMYHLTYYQSDGKRLPQVTLQEDAWWGSSDVGYGTYDTLNAGSWGYLFGQTPTGDMTVARVDLTDPLGNVPNREKYEYWVNGKWSKTKPNKNQNNLGITNAYEGGQGKFFWSPYWNSYVWVGGNQYPGCTFYMHTAPDITGPWTSHDTPIYTGCENGSGLGAYSLLPHPDLGKADGSELYLSWTIVNKQGLYENLLAHLVWH